MSLRHLPIILLQNDNTPLLEDYHHQLQREADDDHIEWAVHPNGQHVAIGLGQRLVLLALPSPDDVAPVFHTATVVEAETITALVWLTPPSPSSTDACLLVGTSLGYLQLHASNGTLLHRQDIHHTALVSLSVRVSGSSILPTDGSEEVIVGFADAVVRVATWEIWAVMRWHLGAGPSGGFSWGGGAPSHNLSFTKWSLGRGIGLRTGAVALGLQPPSLYSLLKTTAGSKSPAAEGVRLLTVGASPPVATFALHEGAQHGIASLVGALAVSKASALLGKARGFVPGRSSNEEGVKREKVPGLPAAPCDAIWDEDKRLVTRIALSPCCRWAACCDTLGRVSFLDAVDNVVLRLFKGYREGQAAWLSIPPLYSTPPSASPAPGTEASQTQEQPQQLVLLLYAPRRAVVEVWLPLQGLRLGTLPGMPRRGLLMQQPIVPVATGGGGKGGRKGLSVNRCWMLSVDALTMGDLTPQVWSLVQQHRRE